VKVVTKKLDTKKLISLVLQFILICKTCIRSSATWISCNGWNNVGVKNS